MTKPLRIFLSCQQATRAHAIPAYSFWSDYFRGALAEAGHEIIEAPACDWAEGLLPTERPEHRGWLTRTWEQAFTHIRREHERRPIDLFLSYLFPAQVDPAAIAAIRALGIPCVNFFCDNVREFRRVPDVYRGFDLHWVPEHKAIPLYQTAGLKFLCAPMACWVPPKFRTPVTVESEPVTFVGSRDSTREHLFAEAIKQGLEVALKGPGWLSTGSSSPKPQGTRADPLTILRRKRAFIHQHGWSALLRQQFSREHGKTYRHFNFKSYAAEPVFGDAYWQALRNCSVCLGVNRYPSWRFPPQHPDTYSRLRDIEAPMAGACYLTEWTEGLQEMYDLGSEVETYRSTEELVVKAQLLVENKVLRKNLRTAAQKRALEDHSIARTVDKILNRI